MIIDEELAYVVERIGVLRSLIDTASLKWLAELRYHVNQPD